MKSTKYTVTTTPQIVVPEKNYNRNVYLHVTGNGIVYLGDSNVTSTNGFLTEKASPPQNLFIPAGENVYGVVATGTEDLRVLDWSN